MSASRMPTLRPSAESPRARLTAVVDLPTPPLPEATAMIAATPGMPAGDGAAGPPDGVPGRGRGACGCGGAARPPGPAPPVRSAVSATRTDCTPGNAETAF